MFILKYIGLLWNIIKENNDDECSEIYHVGEPAGSRRLWYNSCHVEQVIPQKSCFSCVFFFLWYAIIDSSSD